MAKIQEICVFFPCHTLEDFPTHLKDEDAAGLLAAWTAPWHPHILAQVGAIPAWYRADTPPVELSHRVLLAPSASESRLPRDLSQRIGDAENCHLLSVKGLEETAKEILSLLNTSPDEFSDSSDSNASTSNTSTESASSELTSQSLEHSTDSLVKSFFSLGYAALQVQLMTRQLRYSSNLDLVTFSEHVIAAAKATVSNDTTAATERLQAAFDLLGEERDHYFSSDPHLVDLILIAPSTVGPELAETLEDPANLNFLVSAEVAELIAVETPDLVPVITKRVHEGSLSICGGMPDDTLKFDLLPSQLISQTIEHALDRTERALGVRPKVFARLGGGIPGDLPPWLIASGFIGAITNDFTSGVGSQNEAKLLWQAGGVEIEALTAAPKDVMQPQTFLGLGPKLGEAADSGQVAAALLVRWPGQPSPWLESLKAITSHTIALGKFWTLEDFFTKGERPYHSCTLPNLTADGSGLEHRVSEKQDNPLSGPAETFLDFENSAVAEKCAALAALLNTSINPDAGTGAQNQLTLNEAANRLAIELGYAPVPNPNPDSATPASSVILIQPNVGPARHEVTIQGLPPDSKTPGLYGASRSKSEARVTVDIPGIGFASFHSGTKVAENASPQKGIFSWFQKPKPIAHGQSLTNEFMDVAIHPQHGGIAAVHCGQQRGNRFSWQLALYDSKAEPTYSKMRCSRIRVLYADVAMGVIQATGDLVVDDKVVASFVNEYTLRRGMRWLDIKSEIELHTSLRPQPWENYLAGRAAWATEALSVRPLVRDKRHRTSGKKLETPLGVVVDEGDRKLQVCSYGYPAHRRVDAQHLDSLLIVSGENQRSFRLSYGFDVPAPIRAAHHRLVPPIAVPLSETPTKPTRQWLVDLEPASTYLASLKQLDTNKFSATIVETAGKSNRARLRFFKDVTSVERIGKGTAPQMEDGAILVSLSSYEAISLVFSF